MNVFHDQNEVELLLRSGLEKCCPSFKFLVGNSFFTTMEYPNKFRRFLLLGGSVASGLYSTQTKDFFECFWVPHNTAT